MWPSDKTSLGWKTSFTRKHTHPELWLLGSSTTSTEVQKTHHLCRGRQLHHDTSLDSESEELVTTDSDETSDKDKDLSITLMETPAMLPMNDVEDAIDGGSPTPNPQQPQPNPMDGLPNFEDDIILHTPHHRRRTRRAGRISRVPQHPLQGWWSRIATKRAGQE